jgi:hypothetical protein
MEVALVQAGGLEEGWVLGGGVEVQGMEVGWGEKVGGEGRGVGRVGGAGRAGAQVEAGGRGRGTGAWVKGGGEEVRGEVLLGTCEGLYDKP